MEKSKKYWQSFGELKNTEKYRERTFEKELAHKKKRLPIEEIETDLSKAPTSRRDFLKYLGFSTAAATVVSGCQMPVQKAIPFLNPPENVVPGSALYYATAYASDGQVAPVVAKVRDGRPIKIAGNTQVNAYTGHTSAQVQASVLDVYDVARLRAPMQRANGADFAPISDVAEADAAIVQRLKKAKGRIALVSNSVASSVSKELVAAFCTEYGAQSVVYDAVSYTGLLEANKKCYGLWATPTYRLDKAEVVVSVGADFIGTWLQPMLQAKAWGETRKVTAARPRMSKLYQFEALMSLTGANADERYVARAGVYPLLIAALYEVVNGQSVSVALEPSLKEAIEKAGRHLIRQQGKSVLLCDSNDAAVQVLVNAINHKIGALETVIDWRYPCMVKQGDDRTVMRWIQEIQKGVYEVVIFMNEANPVYELPQGKALQEALQRVPAVISLNRKLDETAQAAHFIFPDHHYLESWGDVQLDARTHCFQQPTLHPLFRTRNWQTSLLYWLGRNEDFGQYSKRIWLQRLGGQSDYDKAIQRGFWIDSEKKSVQAHGSFSDVEAIYEQLKNKKAWEQVELVLYQKVGMGSGKMAHNPWLQELPDPITKATWDNYMVLSPKMAAQLGIFMDDDYEVEPEKPVLSLSVAGQTLELPMLIVPGVHPQVVGIALGYGRDEKIGKAVVGVGKNAAPLIGVADQVFSYVLPAQMPVKTNKEYPIAYTQTHNSYEGRAEVVREFTLSEFKENPHILLEKRAEVYERYGNGVTDETSFVEKATLYPQKPKDGLKWGLSLDMNACFGCGACVVSCNAENNISVVGKKQVMKSHEMHWLRIDRYFSGNHDNPEVVFQPMMCQHCDNAPCENVCPVGATMHSEEGLNHMAYNRCVGTRYCANNCPYKVRRFNWLDWNDADSFADNQRPLVAEGTLDQVVLDMGEDLTRMVLNPDVVLRGRGVIEKCSMCVQRLQEAKVKAKKAGRPIQDGDVVLACAEVCPSDAIVFGNVNDPNSRIAQLRAKDQKERVFYVLEQLHVLPNVNYLAKIRNNEAG